VRAEIRGSVVLAFVFFLSTAVFAQNAPYFRFAEAPGPHPVGLKVVEQYDLSRTFRGLTDDLGKPSVGERARPLQTLVWYPAEKSSAKPMTVADYGNLQATEISFGKPMIPADMKEWMTEAAPTLTQSLWAVRDAEPTPGHFPVVIYAPSFSSQSWENADLCEYLASHGYVVIASPDMGATARDMTMDLAGIDAQARDISFLIGYAQTLPDTDMSAVAVAGYSWGGISNLFAAARDNRIDALVALDGSMRYFPGLVKDAGYVHPEQMTIPLLFFTQGEITLEKVELYHSAPMQTGPNVLNAWTHGDLVTVDMMGLIHLEFSSMFQRDESTWKQTFGTQQKADYGREDGVAGYAWVAKYTVHFLDAYLKHDAAALAYLKKTADENGAPQHFLAVRYRAAQGTPVSLEAFRAALGQRGFDHAAEVFAAMQKQKPDFKLDETIVNNWGYELMQEKHLPEAIELLKLNAQMYPDSSNAFESLGEAYGSSGERQLAIESYTKALDKDPRNQDAKEKLKQLESSVAPTK
jgi:tetratricopeptide (TPR) repeat protein